MSNTRYPDWLLALFLFGVATICVGFITVVVAGFFESIGIAAISSVVVFVALVCVRISLGAAEKY